MVVSTGKESAEVRRDSRRAESIERQNKARDRHDKVGDIRSSPDNGAGAGGNGRCHEPVGIFRLISDICSSIPLFSTFHFFDFCCVNWVERDISELHACGFNKRKPRAFFLSVVFCQIRDWLSYAR